MDCSLPGSTIHGVFQARILEWVGHFLLQEIFLTQELNLGLLHCGQMLYRLNHQGSPKLGKMATLRNKHSLSINMSLSSWACLEDFKWKMLRNV